MAIKLSNVTDQPGGSSYFTLFDDAAPPMERTRMSFEYPTQRDANAAHKDMVAALEKASVTAPEPRPR
jgi:hypothetical protein